MEIVIEMMLSPFQKKIDGYEDIKELEKLIKKVWYDDDRELTLINFKKLA